MAEESEDEVIDEELEDDEMDDNLPEDDPLPIVDDEPVVDIEYDGVSDVSDDPELIQKLECIARTDLMTNQEGPLNYEDIKRHLLIVRREDGAIEDPHHTTVPYLTKYEFARVVGMRVTQLNTGAQPFVEATHMDSVIIAEQEIREKKLPFIIRRPIPNKSPEFWRLCDLELL
jgi:DNA-directed RNA polymerase I, II, and III subunit RPABC2